MEAPTFAVDQPEFTISKCSLESRLGGFASYCAAFDDVIDCLF
jgi:hypothetical protein